MSLFSRAIFLVASAPIAASLLHSGGQRWGQLLSSAAGVRDGDAEIPHWDFTGDNLSFAFDEASAEAALEAFVNGPGEADPRCMVYRSHFRVPQVDEGMFQKLDGSGDLNVAVDSEGSTELNTSADLNAIVVANESTEDLGAATTGEISMLGEELRAVCMGAAWDGRRCQEVAGVIRHFTWSRLTAATTGIPMFEHLRSHGKVPPLKTFRSGGGVAASIPCRHGEGSANLHYRHVYKAAGMAIKKNLALLAHKSSKSFVDSAWRTQNLCNDLISKKNSSSPKPVLFTFVRDPMEKFIAGYKELASRGVIDAFRGSKVGTVEHAMLFLDNVFHGSCDNGHVLLQVQSMMGPSCESRFDFIGKVEGFKPHWHKLGEAAGCTDKLYWPRNWERAPGHDDQGADAAIRMALAADGGRLAQALCVWLLPDYMALDYPFPEPCRVHADLLQRG